MENSLGSGTGILSLNAVTGAQLWAFGTSGTVSSSPAAIASGSVVVGSSVGGAFAFDENGLIRQQPQGVRLTQPRVQSCGPSSQAMRYMLGRCCRRLEMYSSSGPSTRSSMR